MTALFIASKYEEVYSVPHIRDLVYVCDDAYIVVLLNLIKLAYLKLVVFIKFDMNS